MSKTQYLLTVIQDLSNKIREIKEKEFQKTKYQDVPLSFFHYINAINSLHNPTFLELSNKLKLSKPSITVAVNKLIERGFAKKTQSQEDGRVFHIALTSEGKALAKASENAQLKVVDYISGKLSAKEVDDLVALLSKIS